MIDLMLDSGAFSAWSQKVDIDIQDYIKFIKDNQQYITHYVNLDVIGDPVATFQNQIIMEEAGLKPIPVFHTHLEDEKWLVKYMDRGYDYIGLGGMAGGTVNRQMIMLVLDRVFSKYICDPNGMPKVKIHGFGMTSLKLMLRYPWYSVDSTSWILTGRLGSIMMPQFKGGKYIYDENSWKISVSNRSPNMKDAGKHFATMTSAEKKVVEQYLKDKGYKMGKSSFKKVDPNYTLQENERWADKKKDKNKIREVEIIEEEGISNKYQLRDEMNIIYFLDLEKSMPAWPWAFKVKHGMRGMIS